MILSDPDMRVKFIDHLVTSLASPNYGADQKYFLSSSSQIATCVVEVGSTDDTAIVVRILPLCAHESRNPLVLSR